MESDNRVVVLIDMDCFYCQVEEKLNPELTGQPIAVVQYNPWKGGGIIAVNYVARAMGVTRHMRGDEAKAKCPEIKLPSVPCSRGKADITKYRDAGKEVARVLQKFTSLLERASIDEAYLDITAKVQERLSILNVHTVTTELLPNTYALGYGSVDEFLADVHGCGSDSIEFDYEHAKRLLVGAVIVSEIRAAVYEETGYRCSAGIAHNKILAKLVCGMNKPNKQTILPKHSIDILYKTLPVRKVKHLGGKFGDTVCQTLSISTMAELQVYSEKALQNKFDEKNGTWLYNIARGVDLEPVQARFNPKSIGCCKQFRGKSALLDLESVRKWLKDLGDEIEDRLEKDALESNRTPKQMVVSFSTRLHDGRDTSSSRSYNFTAEDDLSGDLFSSKAFELLLESSEGVKSKEGETNRRLKAPIEFLGISIGKFQDHADEKKNRKIKDYFSVGLPKSAVEKPEDTEEKNTCNNNCIKDNGKEYILQKFFQASGRVHEQKTTVVTDVVTVSNPTLLEPSLYKQESFFANILNKKSNSVANSIDSELSHQGKAGKPNTPVCEMIECGEDSADTEYSGSTINMEINKSIALFEEDPKDIDRIDNIRHLLNSSSKNLERMQETSDLEAVPHNNSDTEDALQVNNIITTYLAETIICSECSKTIPILMVETHADYHLALKLRDEERQQVRNDREKKLTLPEDKKRNKSEELIKLKKRIPDNQATTSIANFLVNVDVTIPTDVCTECGKNIPIEKFSEHLDFHEAQKLSRQINRRSNDLTGSTKRKRSSTSPVKKLKVPNCKSIDSFFKQK